MRRTAESSIERNRRKPECAGFERRPERREKVCQSGPPYFPAPYNVAMTTPPRHRSRGRPAVGERIAVRLPADLLGVIDARAAASGQSRAGAIRGLLSDALLVPAADGVDRAQIRRMRALSPRERIRHMAAVADAQASIRGAARRRRR